MERIEDKMMLNLYDNFLWGVSTSSFQIEGLPLADGATSSDWYEWTKVSGKIKNGDTADVATNHYSLFREDIAIMKELGIRAYRFSISWPRIQPEEGKINKPGIDFYDRLIDELLKYNIKPVVTIFHWDLPIWQANKGGWLDNRISERFSDYANILFDKFGDRVRYWITLNEPYVYMHSYVTGLHPPGHKDCWQELLSAYHNLLIAHGKTVCLFRELNKGRGKIGITLNHNIVEPLSHSPEDMQAAKYLDGIHNRWFLDSIFKGVYPSDMVNKFGGIMPVTTLKEMEMISSKIDFLGINYYCKLYAKWDGNALLNFSENLLAGEQSVNKELTIYPQGIRNALLRIKNEYGNIDIYITENGCFDDPEINDKRILLNDNDRINYLKRHWEACLSCIKEGLPLKGYFIWSLLDNFEWTHGYSLRFGIVHVDFNTQKRTLKNSAKVYADFIKKGQIF